MERIHLFTSHGVVEILKHRFVREIQCLPVTGCPAAVWSLARKALSVGSALPGVSRQAAQLECTVLAQLDQRLV